MFLADDTETLNDPLPKHLGEMVTPRQLAIIRQLSASVGVEPEAECRLYFTCVPDDLSRRAAAAFIEHLSRMSDARRTAI